MKSEDLKTSPVEEIKKEVRQLMQDYEEALKNKNYQEFLNNIRTKTFCTRNVVLQIGNIEDSYLFHLGKLYALVDVYRKEIDRRNEECRGEIDG